MSVAPYLKHLGLGPEMLPINCQDIPKANSPTRFRTSGSSLRLDAFASEAPLASVAIPKKHNKHNVL